MFSSVTLYLWHWTPEKKTYRNLEILIYAGDLKTHGVVIAKFGIDNVSKPITEFSEYHR